MSPTTRVDAVQGPDSAIGSPPGNRECAEQFPEFCLHSDDRDLRDLQNDDSDGASQSCYSSRPSTPLAKSPLSARSSILSTASTAASSIASFPYYGSKRSSVESSGQVYDPWTSPTPPQRCRRDKEALQAARFQRSGSRSLSLGTKNKPPSSSVSTSKPRRFQRSTSSPADALAAIEPPHDQGLTRMAFAEQQRWITVQEKTFTKWYEILLVGNKESSGLIKFVVF